MPLDAASSLTDLAVEVAALVEAAAGFVPPTRVAAHLDRWLDKARPTDASEQRLFGMMADATLLAADLALSEPGAKGSTAFDRLARGPGGRSMPSRAIEKLRRSRVRLLILVEQRGEQATVRDAVSGETLTVVDTDWPGLEQGIGLFGRVAMLGEATCCLPTAVTPLDASAIKAALSHPCAGRDGAAGSRWAEAVYARVVRHGPLEIAGLNRPREWGPGYLDDDGEAEEVSVAERLTMRWSALEGRAPDEALLRDTREAALADVILDGLAGAARLRHAWGGVAIADAAERMLAEQIETLARRGRGGSGALDLTRMAALVADAVQQGYPRAAVDVFERLARRADIGASAGGDELIKVMQRIEALRAKTVSQGCTEQEALAAAGKVAELLDRYGLSLSEADIRAQPCEGVGVDTGRRRAGPVDNCAALVASLFDCRTWMEHGPDGALRHVFFGLRADVAGARYLFEMVERAFATETEAFRRGPIHANAPIRKGLVASFQIGFCEGLCDKLAALRAARERQRGGSGRDLVPAKDAAIDAEMDKLGLRLKTRRSRSRRVAIAAYEAGEAAGQRFEYVMGIAAE